MKTSEEYTDIAWQFATRHFGTNLECVLAGGSLIQGTGGPESDLDLVIICKSLPNPYIWKTREDEILFDCKVFDIHSLEFEFYKLQNHIYYGFMLHLIAHSRSIPDTSPIGNKFINQATRALKQGPMTKDADYDFMRFRLGNMISDLEKKNATLSQIINIATETFTVAIPLFFLHHGKYVVGGRVLHDAANELDPTFWPELQRSLGELHTTGKPDAYIVFLKKYMDEFGGSTGDNFRHDLPKAPPKPIG